MSPTGSARGRSRVMPYGMDAFMLGIGMLGMYMPGLHGFEIPLQAAGTVGVASPLCPARLLESWVGDLG